MARNYLDLAVQHNEFLQDTLNNSVIVASRMVCASDRSCKKRVAAEHILALSLKITYSAGSVAWSLDDFKGQASDLYLSTFCHISGFEGGRHRCAEETAEIGIVLQCDLVGRVHIYRQAAINRSEFSNSEYVVKMTVCKQDADRLEALGIDKADEAVSLCRSLESRVCNGAVSFLIPYHAAACLEGIEGKIFVIYHLNNSLKHTKIRKGLLFLLNVTGKMSCFTMVRRRGNPPEGGAGDKAGIIKNTLTTMHIAIAGNIGSGKTTLTKMLAAHYGWTPKFESVDYNPYLADFYDDMERWSFNLQVYFLNKRFKDVVDISKLDEVIIQDRTIYEDARIFAPNLHGMGLMSTRDFENYSDLFDLMMSLVNPPDLLIYLRSSIPNLIGQIQKRGREYEKSIRIDYITGLNERYENWIKDYKHNLLILDVDRIKFENRPEDFQEVVDKIDAELFGLFPNLK